MFRILLACAAIIAVLAWALVLLAPEAVAGLDPFLLGDPATADASAATPGQASEPNSAPLAPATLLTAVWAIAVLAIGLVLLVRDPRRARR